MGIVSSKVTGKACGDEQGQAQSREYIEYIKNCLQSLRSNVYSIVETIEAHQEHVQGLSKSICNIDTNQVETEKCWKEMCHHSSTGWQGSTAKLLTNIQKSLQYQGQALLSSHRSAELCMNRMLLYYQIDASPSVEKDAKFWDEYDQVVQIKLKEQCEELRKEKLTETARLNQEISLLNEELREKKREIDDLSKQQDKELKKAEEKMIRSEKKNEKLNKTLQSSKADYERQLGLLRTENTSLKKNLNETEKTLKETKRSLENSKSENDALKKKITKSEESLSTNKICISKLNSEVHELKQQLMDNEMSRKVLEENYQKAVENVNTLESKYEDTQNELRTNKACYEKELASSKNKIESMAECISKREESTKRAEKENEELKTSKTDYEKQLISLTNEKKSMADKLNKTEETLKNEKVKFQNMKTELTHDLETVKETVTQLKQEIEHSVKENEKLRFICNDKEASIQTKNARIVSLEADINDMHLQMVKHARTIQIQLYMNLRGDVCGVILNELKTMVSTEMGVERHNVQFVICQDRADINTELPLLVLSIYVSRLGTDVKSSLNSIHVLDPLRVAVVIFHHKDAHALPNQRSDRVLTGPEFEGLKGIFDIAFLTEKGIYDCDMNREAASGIGKFLKTKM